MSSEQLKDIFDKLGNKILYEDIERVCSEHNIGDFKHIIKILGKTNVIIILETATGKYVLRFLTFPPSKKRLQYVEETVLCLKRAGLPVENAIRNNAGEYSSYINDRIIQVYPFVEGFTFSMKPEQIKSSGMMLNKFHQSLLLHPSGPLPAYSNLPSKDNLIEKLKYLYKRTKKYPIESILPSVNSLYSAVMSEWDKVNMNNLSQTIIHDDWHPWNQIYSNTDQVLTILDLDGVQSGYRIYDVAYAIYHIFRNSPDENKKGNIKFFLEGYGELTKEEKSILPLVTAKVALYFIMRTAKKVEKHYKENEPIIQLLLSQESKRFID